MARSSRLWRLPLRFKVSVLVTCLLAAAIGAYLLLALQVVRDDKLVYVYEIANSTAGRLATQARAGFESMQWRLKVFGAFSVADPKARSRLARELMHNDSGLLRVTLFSPGEGGLLSPVHEVVAHERLARLELTGDDFSELDRMQPLPLEQAAAGPVILNRSLPPSAQILTLIVSERLSGSSRPGWAVAADLSSDRVLDMFAESQTYTAYLVDPRGNVLAHPDPELVLTRANLGSDPAVRKALASERVGEGALEFVDQRGHEMLGAFNDVGWGRLSVVTQIDRAEALAATDRLISFSALVGLAISLLAVIVAVIFARRLTGPIQRLRLATADLAAGSWDADPDVESRDEIGDLARDFKRMAQHLRDSQAQVVQSGKLAAVGQLGAGITHEVKNPLGSIKGFAELGLMSLDDPKQVEESFRMIIEGAGRSLDIVSNFLQFTRPSSGVRERLPLNDVVEGGLRIVAHQVGNQQTRLHRELGEAPDILVDPKQIQQVILNLVLNAQEALGQGGNIWVTTRTLGHGSDIGEVEVRDDGPGVPPVALERVFEPFFTTKGAEAGTGLGLSVSYRIIEDHGGEMFAESPPAGGARFVIRFPSADLVAREARNSG